MDSSSSFCRDCCNKAEIKVICPLIGASCGHGCVSMSFCKHCSNHKGISKDGLTVDCGFKTGSSETTIFLRSAVEQAEKEQNKKDKDK